MKKKYIINRIVCYGCLLIVLVVSLFPVYWMLNTALKTNAEIYQSVPTYYPKNISFAGFRALFFETTFLSSMKNSLLVALVVSLTSIFFCMLAAYALTRMQVKGGRSFSKAILYSYLVPRNLTLLPVYMLVASVGALGSLKSLILVYPSFTIPYTMWMLIAYFKTVPKELEEAALIDGCNRLQVMFKIFYPLALPGIISTFIFAFTLCWNEYQYSLVMITDSAYKTFPVMLSDFMIDDVYAWGPLMGGSFLACIPVLLLYTLSNSRINGGITAGAVKM